MIVIECSCPRDGRSLDVVADQSTIPTYERRRVLNCPSCGADWLAVGFLARIPKEGSIRRRQYRRGSETVQ